MQRDFSGLSDVRVNGCWSTGKRSDLAFVRRKDSTGSGTYLLEAFSHNQQSVLVERLEYRGEGNSLSAQHSLRDIYLHNIIQLMPH